MKEVLDADRRYTVEEELGTTGISVGIVQAIISKDLQMQKATAK